MATTSLGPFWGAILAPHATYSCTLDEETHTYTVNGEVFDSVTQILGLEGMSNDYADAPPSSVENAGWRGSNVHLACQFLEEGSLDWASLTDEETGYVQAYDSFLYDTGFTPHPEFTERVLANLSYRVAGKTDGIGVCRDSDIPAILDRKTGDVHPSTALQLAAYGWLADPGRVFQRFAVRLRADGRPLVVPYPIEEYTRDVSVFLAAVTCVQWRAAYTQKRRPRR